MPLQREQLISWAEVCLFFLNITLSLDISISLIQFSFSPVSWNIMVSNLILIKIICCYLGESINYTTSLPDNLSQ